MDINKLKSMIGNKIYDLRMQYDLTQEEFAQRLGTYISKGHISKVESGTIMPSAEFIRSVCISFNISPYYLLNINKNLDEISYKENHLISNFRNLSLEAQEVIINLVSVMSNEKR